jgi:hypothetical protein
MRDTALDLTGPIDPIELTGSDMPFEMFAEARKRFDEAAANPEAMFRGRILQSTIVHMQLIDFFREPTGIAGSSALVTPGILAAGRTLKPVSERKGIIPADPDFAETPYIAAAEKLAAAVYTPSQASPYGREATPEERRMAAALMLLGIQYLEAKAPYVNRLLPRLISYPQNLGYQLGNNVPESLR